MNELGDVRLAQLNVLLEEHNRNQAALARLIGRSPSQIAQWLSGYRTITEPSARLIERMTKKPDGWMDGRANLTAVSAASSGQPSVQRTLDQLAELLGGADERTRGMVADLLQRYAQNPQEGARIAQAIEVLLAPPPKT